MKFTKRDAGAGRVLARRGPVIKRVKIPAIHISPWEVRMPKSAWRSTRRASRKTTPATLLSEPKSMLKSVTNTKQKAITR